MKWAMIIPAALTACQSASTPGSATRFAGVDDTALIAVTGDPRLALVVYRADLIAPPQLATLPDQLCAEAGKVVAEVKHRLPFEPDAYPAGTKLMYVRCA